MKKTRDLMSLLMVAAFAGNRMTFGCLAGIMDCGAALGQKNPWQELFSPSRTTLRGGAWQFVKEQTDNSYYMIADRLTHAEKGELEEIGQGKARC